MSELFRAFGPNGDGSSSRKRKLASRPWYWAHRDPQWEPPKDDPVDENGLTRDQRRIWREFMSG